jgi:type IV pilus assembly protein PilC
MMENEFHFDLFIPHPSNIMAEFICRLGTPSGEIVQRTVEANGVSEVRSRLEQEGFRVFAITNAEGGVLSRRGKKRVKPDDFLLFNQQLSALLRAGIPILQAIGMLRKRSTSERLREVLADVEDKIKNGIPLSTAFAEQGEIFPRIYTASILAGERSGALDEVLARYVVFQRRSVGLRRRIRSALAYPIFLLVASAIMVTFLSIYVVPRMSQLFQGLNKDNQLPFLTRFVVGFSTFLATNIIWIAPIVIAAVALLYLWSRTESGRLAIDAFLLRVPIAGTLIVQLTVAQAARSLATLLAGGITLVDSWEIAGESITNKELRRRSAAILPMIREGCSFTESLESANWIPELASDMIGIGERSGSLKEMLDEVSQFYDAEAEVKLEQLTTVMEPAILVIMGGVVVIILLAIYLPIIQTISGGPGMK